MSNKPKLQVFRARASRKRRAARKIGKNPGSNNDTPLPGVMTGYRGDGSRIEERMVTVDLEPVSFGEILLFVSKNVIVPSCAACGRTFLDWDPCGPHAMVTLTAPDGAFRGILCELCTNEYNSHRLLVCIRLINTLLTEEFGASETHVYPAQTVGGVC